MDKQKMVKFIESYSDFVLNETLKTHDIDLTINKVNTLLSLLKYEFDIEKIENCINVTLNNVNITDMFKLKLDNLNNIMTDRHGWFPAKMEITNLHKNKNILSYDKEFIIKNYLKFLNVKITYEPKYDIAAMVPAKLYHLSIQEYKDDILKIGIVPKSKSKLSIHLDRIYVCDNPDGCYNLINQMIIYYKSNSMKKSLNKKNYKWIIYEINTSELPIKLYKDPNYIGGYYLLDNIPPNTLSIYNME